MFAYGDDFDSEIGWNSGLKQERVYLNNARKEYKANELLEFRHWRTSTGLSPVDPLRFG